MNVEHIAFDYTENHKFAIVRLARKLDHEGKLTASARMHLRAYERALEEDQKAYNAFLKSFEEHL